MTVGSPLFAATIYYDDFSGSGGAGLNATAPDVRPGSETWSSDSQWKANGSIAQPFGSPAHSYLPFVPSAGNVYSLSIDANVTNGQNANHFFSLAYSSTNNLGEAFFPNGFVGLMTKRTNSHVGTDDVDTYLGPSAANHAAFNYDSGALNMKVVLNTQPALWTVEWFVNGSSVRGPVAFGSNPTINYVAFSSFQNTDGTVDNFTLTVVPEPASLALALAGAIAGIAIRRRSRG